MKNKHIFGIIAIALLITMVSGKSLQTNLFSVGDEPQKQITINAVGDIMLSREVANRIIRAKDNAYPFTATDHITKNADITFGNLETAVFKGRKIGIEMVFRSDPETLEGLKKGGFDIVSLANNHTYNFGEEGIKKTMQHLHNENIAHCGAGNTDREAYAPTIITVRDTTIAFLCYNDTDVVTNYTFATAKKAGTAEMIIERMTADVRSIADTVDIVVVSMHSGTEYAKSPNLHQQLFARGAIDAGAHIVIGHHPHVLQPVEQYKHGLIFYSLGNFIFDQYGVRQNQGAIAHITINPETKHITYTATPYEITDFSRPVPVEDEKVKQQILDQLK